MKDQREYWRTRREQRRARGVCAVCSKKVDRLGAHRCFSCRAVESRRIRDIRIEALIDGYCPRCMKRKPGGGTKLCELCIEYNRAKRLRLKAERGDYCSRCRKRKGSNGMKSCDECLAYKREQRRVNARGA